MLARIQLNALKRQKNILQQTFYLPSLTQKIQLYNSKVNHSKTFKDYLHNKINSQDDIFLKRDYLIFKKNINSLENINLYLQYVQSIAHKIPLMNNRSIRRLMKLIVKAEGNMLEEGQIQRNYNTFEILDKSLAWKNLKANLNYKNDIQNKSQLLNKFPEHNQTIENFYNLKQEICSRNFKILLKQFFALNIFKGFACLTLPAVFYLQPYTSLVFLYPRLGGAYFYFAQYQLQNRFLPGVFLSFLMIGSLAYALNYTFTDINKFMTKRE